MSEEIGSVAETQTGSTEQNESTAAAAAFGRARGDIQPEPVVEIVEELPVAPEVAEEPKVLAGMTEKEITELLNEIPKHREYRKQIDNLAGQNGKLNAAIQKLQQETQSGEAVVVTDEDMAEMMEDFPELGNLTRTALNKVLAKVNARGTGPAQTPDDYIALAKKAASEVVSSGRVSLHKEILHGLTPGWDKIIGLPVDGVFPETDYRKWLATQPAEYQSKINESTNAFEIGSSIKTFNEAQAASNQKQQQNKQRLVNAIQPSGQTAPRVTISEQSAAEKAFKASRGR